MQCPSYISATVLDIHPMCEASPIYKLVLAPETQLCAWDAGQFVMLKLTEGNVSFARPFSIASRDTTNITLYIHIRGKETKALHHIKKGDSLSMWGALGTSYSPPSVKTLMIAGGIGIAPFITYSHQYTQESRLLFGHRIEKEHYPLDDIACSVAVELFHDKDANSLTIFLERIKEAMEEYKDGQVLACGPLPLLKYIRSIAIEKNIYTEISVEETMYCGVGACLGCVCKTTMQYTIERLRNSYVQSCLYGPVFPAHSVEL